jgi:hypothetical protein
MDVQTSDRTSAPVATVPAQEAGLPEPGAGQGSATERLSAAVCSRRGQLLLAGAVLVALLGWAWHFNAAPRHDALSALPDTLRAVVATVVLFGIGGFGLTRLLLPAPLRRYELLWVVPTGACAVGLEMTILGFAAMPYPASLALVFLAGLVLASYAVRARGWPEFSLPGLGWPVYLAFVVLTVALTQMVLIQHYAAPVGTGSDAHVATGVAQFLQHSYPTSVNVHQPINQMQPTWQSKYPIYYAFAGVSTVSGLASWRVLATLAGMLLAMSAIGFFLVAREVFRAPVAVALVAMSFAALDRMALYTVLNPYFNQTWGFFAMPFTLVLGWWVVQPGLTRRARQATFALLAVFFLVLVLAYPLAGPIPAVPLVVFALVDRRRRAAAGEQVFRVRNLYRGRRSLLWMIPVAALLAIPVAGAVEKGVSAAGVLLPGHSLQGWSGDLPGFIPWNYFFSLPNSWVGWLGFVVVAALAGWGLARQSRSLAWGLGGLLILALLIATYLRHRQFGYYFEFKLLAFVGPLALLIAAVGAGRLRRLGVVVLAAMSVAVVGSAVAEVKHNGTQLPPDTIGLTDLTKSVPPGASIRLDMWPPTQLWGAYFLASHPVCSQRPLYYTDYPHVAYSRKADYIVATKGTFGRIPGTTDPSGRPTDAIGPPIAQNLGYMLFKENPKVPGIDYCSYRRYDRIYTGAGRKQVFRRP